MSDNTVTVKDLRQIKGLGPRKAQVIKNFLDDADAKATAQELSQIPGVSVRIAQQVARLVRDSKQAAEQAPQDEAPKSETPQDKAPKAAPRKRAARKATKAHSNGTTTARDVRVFARLAEEQGFGHVAATLRDSVSAKLDDETAESVTVTL